MLKSEWPEIYEREGGVHNAKKIGPLAGTVFKLDALTFQPELDLMAFRAKALRSKGYAALGG